MKNTIIASVLSEVYAESSNEFMRSVKIRSDHVFSDKFNRKMRRIIGTNTNPLRIFRFEHHTLVNALSIFAIMAILTFVGVLNFRAAFRFGSDDDPVNNNSTIDSSQIQIDDITITNDMYRFIQCGVPDTPNEYTEFNVHDTSLYRDRISDYTSADSYNSMAKEIKDLIGSKTDSGIELDDSEFEWYSYKPQDNVTLNTIKSMLSVKSKDNKLLFNEYRFGDMFIFAYVYQDKNNYIEDFGNTSLNVSLEPTNSKLDVKQVRFHYEDNGANGVYTYFCPIRYGKNIVLFTCRSTGDISSIEEERYLFCKLMSAII